MVYTVNYKLYSADTEKYVDVPAKSSHEAYTKAVFEVIPNNNDGEHPYSAYVHSRTAQNGNYHVFVRNMHGNPY